MKILKLDNDRKEPLYLQLYSGIKKLIQEGSFPANYRLPSKKNLMLEYNLSQNTVQNALYLLMEEGYIYSEERKGYFVSDLENLFLNTQQEKRRLPKQEKEKIHFDFSYSGVDPSSLPKNIFKKITKEIYDETNDELAYQGDIQGYEPLRQSICDYLSQSRGFEAESNQIIVSSGTEYLFHIIFKLFEQAKYGLENPGYRMLQELFSANQIDYASLSLDQHGIIPQELQEKKITIACITPSHQFPTGIIMPINRRQELLHWANEEEKHYIIEDDYDSEFKYNGRPIPALKAIDYKDKVIYIGSFSKSISPAIRVSYMVLPRLLLQKYQQKIPYFICPVSTLHQKILYKFIQEGHFLKHLNRMRTLYKKKREFLVHCLRENSLKLLGEEIEIQGADAGLHLVISFPKRLFQNDFLEFCLEHSLKIYPLQNYYFDELPNTSSFLLGYASLTKEQIQEGVILLLNLVKEHRFCPKNS